MIYLILILNMAQAGNWMRVDDIKAGLQRGFELKESCEKGTLEDLIEVDSPCPTESEPDAICRIKVPKNLKPVACPTEKEPDAICMVNASCIEIGAIAPDVIGVDESGALPVPVIDGTKQAAKDLKEAAIIAERNKRLAAETALKNLPTNIPAQGVSGALHNLLEFMGVK